MSFHSPGLALRFIVKMEGLEGMHFTGCEGLNAEYETETFKEGGNPGSAQVLPIRLKYTNLKLTRPVDSDSGKVAGWFHTVQTELKPRTGEIRILDGNGRPVATYKLRGVWPIKYTGPHLKADSNAVAHETLELSHSGFEVTA
jgi:phage tail-like protein